MRPPPPPQQRHRQLRLRVLTVLESRVKDFIRRDELWPIRIPRQPLVLDRLIGDALREEGGALEPLALRSRSLLRFEWPDGSRWEAWVIVLPSGIKLYCDTSEYESRVLASGGRNEGDESDRAFLQLLAESAGRHFGIEMSGGAPERVHSTLRDRGFLVECFVNLFEVTGAEESVREQLGGETARARDGKLDFRADVEAWLDAALRA
jgi:hypothetical protein